MIEECFNVEMDGMDGIHADADGGARMAFLRFKQILSAGCTLAWLC